MRSRFCPDESNNGVYLIICKSLLLVLLEMKEVERKWGRNHLKIDFPMLDNFPFKFFNFISRNNVFKNIIYFLGNRVRLTYVFG